MVPALQAQTGADGFPDSRAGSISKLVEQIHSTCMRLSNLKSAERTPRRSSHQSLDMSEARGWPFLQATQAPGLSFTPPI